MTVHPIANIAHQVTLDDEQIGDKPQPVPDAIDNTVSPATTALSRPL